VDGVPDPQPILVGCNPWSFTAYQRAPLPNGSFTNTSDINLVKLISMSWTCARTNIIRNLNSESTVTAQVVLRNKP
jgi:hypothetical protein